jgi:hypothetical protein
MASGDELLKNFSLIALSGTTETTVTAGHTYTIISITLNEQAGAAETFAIYVDTDGSGADCFIYLDHVLPAKATFVHNDKIVLTAGQKLGITASTGNTDVFVSYLDQEL